MSLSYVKGSTGCLTVTFAILAILVLIFGIFGEKNYKSPEECAAEIAANNSTNATHCSTHGLRLIKLDYYLFKSYSDGKQNQVNRSPGDSNFEIRLHWALTAGLFILFLYFLILLVVLMAGLGRFGTRAGMESFSYGMGLLEFVVFPGFILSFFIAFLVACYADVIYVDIFGLYIALSAIVWFMYYVILYRFDLKKGYDHSDLIEFAVVTIIDLGRWFMIIAYIIENNKVLDARRLAVVAIAIVLEFGMWSIVAIWMFYNVLLRDSYEVDGFGSPTKYGTVYRTYLVFHSFFFLYAVISIGIYLGTDFTTS